MRQAALGSQEPKRHPVLQYSTVLCACFRSVLWHATLFNGVRSDCMSRSAAPPWTLQVNEACCDAHQKELVARPNLEEIVNYDQWARRWVKEHVESGAFKKVVVSV